jgi:hypothetical protein
MNTIYKKLGQNKCNCCKTNYLRLCPTGDRCGPGSHSHPGHPLADEHGCMKDYHMTENYVSISSAIQGGTNAICAPSNCGYGCGCSVGMPQCAFGN